MHTFEVPDMTCGHCVATITRAVKAADASARVEVFLAAHRVTIESKLSREELARLIAAAGYAPRAQAMAQ
jgi:copper chaperone